MKENKKMVAYVTPMVEVLNARIEKGFAGSGNSLTAGPTETIQNGTVYNDGDFD